MAESLLENYNPLYDVHLRQYFALPHMQKHLRRMGLLDSNGVPVSQNGNVESELYARHHAMMDMMLRNRERVLMQLADLQKKYDAAEKVEIYRRVRSGVTDAEEFRRNHLSRSLSRPRRSATQPVKTSGRRRHSSNSFEDTEVIKRIETTYEQPQTPQANIKNTYDRLSANAFKYQFLHKLDDTTLINYKDSLQKQLQKLKRFRDISFGPHNVARHQTSQPASWFFRRRSLPSLSNSAPQNSLHSPIRSLKAAKDANEKSNGSSNNGTADEHRRRQGKSQSPRRQMAADRPRPRRAASPTKRAATTHAGTRLPPINNKESAPLKPPRIQQRTAPTPQSVEEEKRSGFLDKITGGVVAAAGGVAAAAAAVGGTVSAAIGASDNEEEHAKDEPEEMDTTEDEAAPKTPSPPGSPEAASAPKTPEAASPPRSPEAAPSPVHVEQEETAPSPVHVEQEETAPSPVHVEQEEAVPSPVPSSHHTEVESPIPSPRHEEVAYKTPSPVSVHITESSPRHSPTEEEEQEEEPIHAASPRQEEEQQRSPTPESHEVEAHVEHSPAPSPQHEEVVHQRSPTPEQHEIQSHEEHSPAPSPRHEEHEEIHHKTPSPVESFREHHEEHIEHEFAQHSASPDQTEEQKTSSPTDHAPSRFDEAHDHKAHSFHEDDLRSIERNDPVSHDIEVEDTQSARDKRGASFEAEEVLEREAEERAEEFNGVQDQSNGAGAELEHNQEEVEKLTDDHEEDDHHRERRDVESLHSQHEEGGYDNQSLPGADEEQHGHEQNVGEASPRASEKSHSPAGHEHERQESPVSQRDFGHQDLIQDTGHHGFEDQADHGAELDHENHLEDHHDIGHEIDHAAPEHDDTTEVELDQHEKQSNYAESHGERSVDLQSTTMEQSIYQPSDNFEIEHHNEHFEAPSSPPGSPTELLSPESPIQKAQDVMVNSFYPGAEHDEPPKLPTPDPDETVEERSHEEHVERDPIQAHEHAFEPGFISASGHDNEVEEQSHHHHEAEEHQYNGIQDEETLEPPISNRSLESFQRHEEEVAADIQHDHDIENDQAAHQYENEIYNDENQEPSNHSITSPGRGHLLNQPSIEITAPSDFGDAQVDEISAPPTPNSPHTTTTAAASHVQSYEHEVIEHPLHERENNISDDEVNENSSLLANGHEGDQEDQDEEDDDDDTGSVVMHKTPDSANYQHQHHQYQRSDDEQSETGQGHL